ncbi:MAG TPA: 30S ribosomal protein S3 [Dehalococcoidia bacterium]|nr:30S ribosomal protein S3 [Dehalococcoidia bacterium]
MGRKVHPIGFRIGIIQDWQAKWYADTNYAQILQEDLKLRQAIQSKYADAAISLVEIDHQAKEVAVTIHTARPGIVIGRGGQRVDELSSHLEKLIGKKVRLNIQEIRQPELDANLVARTIADQIERRIAYRRAMKQAIFRTMQAGAKGIRVSCSGRLGDAEIARRQTMHEGQVPLHTLRADIDYGFAEAHTTLGRIGVKVWIYKGEILPEPKEVEVEEAPAEAIASPTAEEIAPVTAAEEKLAEPEAVETAEAVAEAVPEAPAEAAPEEKPAKPARRKAKETTAEEKPAEPVAEAAEAVAEAAPEAPAEAPPEEKPAKVVRRRSKKAATEETTAEAKPEVEEEKDAAT